MRRGRQCCSAPQRPCGVRPLPVLAQTERSTTLSSRDFARPSTIGNTTARSKQVVASRPRKQSISRSATSLRLRKCDHVNMTTDSERRAWLVRAGKTGEHDEYFLEHGLAGVGFDEVPDLAAARTREDVKNIVRNAFPDGNESRLTNFTGQLWKLRGKIAAGDLVVLPLKSTGQVAIGVATGSYRYDSNQRLGRK